jgi:trans-2,3-dihydro-3-hydroxyanthranilate isomerase
MKDYEYSIVDVFTETRLEGNALAVFRDARGLDSRTMQRIAREMNLSESTFVLPPTAAESLAVVRIFTPQKELAFAGHPTIGTSFVLWSSNAGARRPSSFVLEEGVGAVAVRVADDDANGNPLIWLRTPPIDIGQSFEPTECARLIGLAPADLHGAPPEIVSAGNPALFIAVRDREAVDSASLDAEHLHQLKRRMNDAFFVFVFAATENGAYSRMFAPDFGVPEDPATGSATGPLAVYMMRHGLVSTRDQTRFVSEQGTKMGRRSLLHVLVHGDNGSGGIEVGGHVTPVAEGRLTI